MIRMMRMKRKFDSRSGYIFNEVNRGRHAPFFFSLTNTNPMNFIFALENASTEFTQFADRNPFNVKDYLESNPNLAEEPFIICKYDKIDSIVPQNVWSPKLFLIMMQEIEWASAEPDYDYEKY